MRALPEGFRLTRPDLVLYHADCPDGFGAAWALRQFFPVDAGTAYQPLAYGAALVPGQYQGTRLLMVDVSLPRAAFVRLSQEADVFLLDHHASAAEELGDLPNTYFDLQRSGAGLAWDVASNGGARPLLVDLIEDRDLLRHHLSQTPLLRVLDSLPQTFSAWSAFARDLVQDPDRLALEAAAIDRYEQALAQRLAPHALPVVQQGARGWAVNAPGPLADAMARVLLERPDTDFALSWFFDGLQRKTSCSWRTRPGAPAQAVDLAREYGGGGHLHAAGARLTGAELRSLLASVAPPN